MPIIQTVIKGKEPVIDTLSVTPSTSAQQITAPQGTDGYSPVNVSAVTSSIDANIVAGNIKKDVQILGVTGSYEGTTPTGTVNITSNGTHNVSSYEYAEVLVPTTAPSRYLQYSTDANGKLIHDPAASSLINLNGVTDVGEYVLYQAYKNNQQISGLVDLSNITTVTGKYSFNEAFMGCTGITGVDLSSLTNIVGEYCFSYCFQGCTNITSINLSSFYSFGGSYEFYHMFDGCTGLLSVSIPNLYNSTGSYSCEYMFAGCFGLNSVSLNIIKIAGQYSCAYMFDVCSGLTSFDLSKLVQPIAGSCCRGMFRNCTNLSSIDISHLCKIGTSNCLQQMFMGCTSLTSLSFPNLAYTATNFNGAFTNMLSGVTGCTVHFPAEWQTTMSGWSNVTNGFGGTNTTVLFDLPNVTTLDLSNLTIVGGYSSLGTLGNNNYFTNVTKVDLSGVIKIIGDSALTQMFANNTSLTSFDLSALTEITAENVCQNMFSGCIGLTSANLGSLTIVDGTNVFSNTFNGCTSLTSVNLSSLKTFNSSFYYGFKDCTGLTTLSFPALKIVSDAYVFNDMLNGVTGCTVRFPSNLSGYGFGVGGSNTVLYDLPATNILTGADTVEYERNPKYDTATALAWRVNGTMPNTTTYYTSGLTDPTVGTTIYSDSACTIAETTVDSVI